jgi:hypothetical protein
MGAGVHARCLLHVPYCAVLCRAAGPGLRGPVADQCLRVHCPLST